MYFLLPKSFGNRQCEYTPGPARFEVRRLQQIGATGFDVVVGTNRNIDRLVFIPVVVTNEDEVLAVLRRPPTFERRIHSLTRVAERKRRRDSCLWALRGIRPGRLLTDSDLSSEYEGVTAAASRPRFDLLSLNGLS